MLLIILHLWPADAGPGRRSATEAEGSMVMGFTAAYWKPGKWFNYACIDRSVPGWELGPVAAPDAARVTPREGWTPDGARAGLAPAAGADRDVV